MELLDFLILIVSGLCFAVVFLFWWSGPPSRHPEATRGPSASMPDVETGKNIHRPVDTIGAALSETIKP